LTTIENTGAAWSSDTITRKPFESFVSVNWILRSGAAATPITTITPAAHSRLNWEVTRAPFEASKQAAEKRGLEF
jgi:hypothetical protein